MALNEGREIWVTSVHPGLVETNLATAVGKSGPGMSTLFLVLRILGLMWSTDKGSWTSLFCIASQDMKAEQSGAYLEMFRRFGEPRWQSGAAKDERLAERLESGLRRL
ncbi:NAD(P)-binding protein [Penicillium malachiteum]|uniref:NAD(P)-binding protein n=1 Tax=Penicillium malachiteum TaxID=1324776 RepID=UPI002548AD6F|nr:NAD(P)-binding protein [Penicillium malachiteum]KAJ5721151.1 NAD(P)-binding protein [Penicillium malachiteum]